MQVYLQMDDCSSSSMCATLQALAAMHCCPPRLWMSSFFSISCDIMSEFGNDELSRMLASLASFPLVPPRKWMDRLWGESLPRLPAMKPLHVSDRGE
jgi:hypothetical protein